MIALLSVSAGRAAQGSFPGIFSRPGIAADA